MDINIRQVEERNHKYIYPCKMCLVFACCDIICAKVFEYCNFIADNIYKLDNQQYLLYRDTTPIAVSRKIQNLYTKGARMSCPESFTMKRSEKWRI